MIKSKPQTIPKPKHNSKKSPSVQQNYNEPEQNQEKINNNYEDESILLCLNPIDQNHDKFSSKSKKKVVFKNPIVQNDCSKPDTSKKRSKGSKKQPQVTATVENENKKSSLKVALGEYFLGADALWKYTSTRWAARLEHLSELKPGAGKVVHSKSSDDISAIYCENQSHFVIGNGPDYSISLLGILNTCAEVVIKKINVKRVPLLLDDVRLKSLVDLPKSPYIAQVHFIVKDKTHFYIVRELGENSLKYVIRMRQYVLDSVKQPFECKKICHSIAKCLAFLHSNNIIHMAIKPENVFVTESGEAKLSDYGLHSRCAAKKQQYSNGNTTLCWHPSEVLGKNEKPLYTKASDIAPLGILFYFLMTEGKHPFGDPETAADTCVNNILHGHYNLKLITDPLAHHLIQNMIYKEPQKRMTIEEILVHPYFWSELEKNVFVENLVKLVVFASNGDICNKKANIILQKMKLEGSSVMQSFVKNGVCFEIPSEIKDNLTAIFQYVYNSSISSYHDNDEAKVFEEFWRTYPGVLLEYYTEINIVEMKKMVENAENSKDIVEKIKFTDLRTLKPTLSADSGVVSPSMDVPVNKTTDKNMADFFNMDVFSFDNGHTRNRNYSDCCTSVTTDDGIDLLSPLSGSFADENMFSSPTKIFPNHIDEYGGKWKSCAGVSESCASSIDNHYEFDGMGYLSNQVNNLGQSADIKAKVQIPLAVPLWTDMDELD